MSDYAEAITAVAVIFVLWALLALAFWSWLMKGRRLVELQRRQARLPLRHPGYVWYSVAVDGKPPKPGRYWVFADGCQTFARTYDPERGADFDEHITHWCELPPKPDT